MTQYAWEGKVSVSLNWRTPEGSTTASPASRWFMEHRAGKEEAMREVLEHLYQGLEYPGTPSDYHFAIQHAHEVLWKRRHEDPVAVQEVERLCLLNLDLVEAYPEMLRTGSDDVEPEEEIIYARYVRVSAFNRLIHLYERAGDIEAALEVARQAQRFEQERGALERLELKLQALNEEELDESDR